MKNITIVIPDHFADWEYSLIAPVLHSYTTNYHVRYAAADLDHKTLMGALRVIPDLTFADIPAENAALILIGGQDWRKLTPPTEPPSPHTATNKKPTATCSPVSATAHGFLLPTAYSTTAATPATTSKPTAQKPPTTTPRNTKKASVKPCAMPTSSPRAPWPHLPSAAPS